MARIAGAVFLVAGMTATSGRPAHAEPPRVRLMPFLGLNASVEPELLSQAQATLAKELRGQGVEAILGPGASRRRGRDGDGLTVKSDHRLGRRSGRQIAKARREIRNGAYRKAQRRLRRVIRALTARGTSTRRVDLLADAYLASAVAYLQDGAEARGIQRLKQCIRLAPKKRLGQRYPPVFRKVYADTRASVLASERGQIDIHAGEGFTVYLDGRRMGRSPLRLADVLPGRHWLRLERPGRRALGARMDVRPGQTATFGTANSGTAHPGAVGGNDVTATDLRALAQQARAARATGTVLVGVFRTETAYQLRGVFVTARGGTARRLPNTAFDLDLLTAEIEIFKMGEAIRTLAGGDRSAPKLEAPFPLAPKFVSGRRAVSARTPDEAVALRVVVAAPAASTARPSSRAPTKVATRSTQVGRAPLPGLLPKDELEATAGPLTSNTPTPTLSRRSSDDDGTPWWVWGLTGVAVAGAAVGGYVAWNAVQGGADHALVGASW